MIKPCTEREKELLDQGVCPDCGCERFWNGPEGGGAVNIQCTKCRAKFNVSPGIKSFAQRLVDDHLNPKTNTLTLSVIPTIRNGTITTEVEILSIDFQRPDSVSQSKIHLNMAPIFTSQQKTDIYCEEFREPLEKALQAQQASMDTRILGQLIIPRKTLETIVAYGAWLEVTVRSSAPYCTVAWEYNQVPNEPDISPIGRDLIWKALQNVKIPQTLPALPFDPFNL